MTWKEYYKENSDKIPKEFADKEITVEDCLKIMDVMSFTIKELFNKTKWHTGSPTEEGWYLVKYKCIYKGKYFGKIEYHTMQITKDEFSHKLDIRGHASDDVWKAIEWQKVEPYKGQI